MRSMAKDHNSGSCDQEIQVGRDDLFPIEVIVHRMQEELSALQSVVRNQVLSEILLRANIRPIQDRVEVLERKESRRLDDLPQNQKDLDQRPLDNLRREVIRQSSRIDTIFRRLEKLEREVTGMSSKREIVDLTRKTALLKVRFIEVTNAVRQNDNKQKRDIKVVRSSIKKQAEMLEGKLISQAQNSILEVYDHITNLEKRLLSLQAERRHYYESKLDKTKIHALLPPRRKFRTEALVLEDRKAKGFVNSWIKYDAKFFWRSGVQIAVDLQVVNLLLESSKQYIVIPPWIDVETINTVIIISSYNDFVLDERLVVNLAVAILNLGSIRKDLPQIMFRPIYDQLNLVDIALGGLVIYRDSIYSLPHITHIVCERIFPEHEYLKFLAHSMVTLSLVGIAVSSGNVALPIMSFLVGASYLDWELGRAMVEDVSDNYLPNIMGYVEEYFVLS